MGALRGREAALFRPRGAEAGTAAILFRVGRGGGEGRAPILGPEMPVWGLEMPVLGLEMPVLGLPGHESPFRGRLVPYEPAAGGLLVHFGVKSPRFGAAFVCARRGEGLLKGAAPQFGKGRIKGFWGRRGVHPGAPPHGVHLGPDLVAALARLDVHDLPHGGGSARVGLGEVLEARPPSPGAAVAAVVERGPFNAERGAATMAAAPRPSRLI